MKDLIRKILREGRDSERIQKNEVLVKRITPRIVRFIEEKFGNDVTVESHDKSVFFGSDDYRGLCKEIKVFVENEDLNATELKVQLWGDIKNFFGIDMTRYGSCLNLEVFKKKWEKV
jgi:hypothetical protein